MKIQHLKKALVILLAFSMTFFVEAQNNIIITDDNFHTADAFAMLDVYSTFKGMPVPGMTTSQINDVLSPATGLLVFNTIKTAEYYVFTAFFIVTLSKNFL